MDSRKDQMPYDSWFGFRRGDLFKKVRDHTWDATLSFAADEEDFRDVQIITLQQYLFDLAVDQAHRERVDLGSLDLYIHQLLSTRFHSAQEFVHVTADSVIVGVNAKRLSERVLDYAKTLLIQIESFKPGTKYYFGKEIKIYGNPFNR